jgi:hypothetical protein
MLELSFRYLWHWVQVDGWMVGLCMTWAIDELIPTRLGICIAGIMDGVLVFFFFLFLFLFFGLMGQSRAQ